MTLAFEHFDENECRLFAGAVELAGRRWSPGILVALARGAQRFSEIRSAVPGLSDRMLTQRLKELIGHGVVERAVLPSTPVQVHYSLTAQGAELLGALQPLVGWGRRWGERREHAINAGATQRASR